MRIGKKEKRKAEINKLREILSRLPQEEVEGKINDLPKIKPVLDELERLGLLWVKYQPGFGDARHTGELSSYMLKKHGVHIITEPPFTANKWDWELIKKALMKIGFCYCGQGQRDWFLNLRP